MAGKSRTSRAGSASVCTVRERAKLRFQRSDRRGRGLVPAAHLVGRATTGRNMHLRRRGSDWLSPNHRAAGGQCSSATRGTRPFPINVSIPEQVLVAAASASGSLQDDAAGTERNPFLVTAAMTRACVPAAEQDWCRRAAARGDEEEDRAWMAQAVACCSFTLPVGICWTALTGPHKLSGGARRSGAVYGGASSASDARSRGQLP